MSTWAHVSGTRDNSSVHRVGTAFLLAWWPSGCTMTLHSRGGCTNGLHRRYCAQRSFRFASIRVVGLATQLVPQTGCRGERNAKPRALYGIGSEGRGRMCARRAVRRREVPKRASSLSGLAVRRAVALGLLRKLSGETLRRVPRSRLPSLRASGRCVILAPCASGRRVVLALCAVVSTAGSRAIPK